MLSSLCDSRSFFFFFFNDTATTEIYTLSLHDALPISKYVELDDKAKREIAKDPAGHRASLEASVAALRDRKSTRLNSSHGYISYAVFCLKKKKINVNHYVEVHRAHNSLHLTH